MTTPKNTPQNVLELVQKLSDVAKSFGFTASENGVFRDCVRDSSLPSGLKKYNENDNNFWFGFIREGESTSQAYEGVSYVIFPEYNGRHCVLSICIGSSSIGLDHDLATSIAFRRSFRKLSKNEGNAKFFFKLNYDEMDAPTPFFQKELESGNYENVLVATSTQYNITSGGLMPAIAIVDYTSQDGYDILCSWLAQYAKWRNWDRYKNGNPILGYQKAITQTIEKCKETKDNLSPKDIYNVLSDRRFIVLQGAPGCGKTWSAEKVASLADENGMNVFEETAFIQFHAETTYADFVYGIKPILDGKSVAYKGEKGILLKILDKAIKSENNGDGKKYLLIIDEFNRANLPSVLGPVFYLFEQTSGNRSKLKLDLGSIAIPDTKEEQRLVYDHIPANLYVIATMNTADKSLAVVDFALRRRFSWITLRPHTLDPDVSPNFDFELFDEFDNLFMEYATDEELNLQPGQSYFLDKNKRRDAIIYGLMPLMKEYFVEGFMPGAKEAFAQLFYEKANVLMFE